MKYLAIAALAAFTLASCTVKEQEAEPTTTVAPTTVAPTTTTTTLAPTTTTQPPPTDDDICDMVWDQGSTIEVYDQDAWCGNVLAAMKIHYDKTEAEQINSCNYFWEQSDDELIWDGVADGHARYTVVAYIDTMYAVCE